MSLPIKRDVILSSWGNFPTVTTSIVRPERYRDLFSLPQPCIPRGLGRSYGDAALLSGKYVIELNRLDRLLAFDETTGLLRGEAGLSLDQLIKDFVPKGWFLPVTPGTKYVTLGGCIAADVHGKNHHRDGSFGQYVKELEVILADGTPYRCSPSQNQELFWATIGGMGLTGVISEAVIQLQRIESAYILSRHCPAPNLEAVLKILSSPETDDKYSVAWIDCLATGKNLGRSVVMMGHHAKKEQLTSRMHAKPLKLQQSFNVSVPCSPPFSLVKPWSAKIFNDIYYRVQSRKTRPHLVGFDPFFYPLDSLTHWNRIYGSKGFVQYQFVLPSDTASDGLHLILDKLANSRRASFLAVLKRFGKQGSGILSFPKEGYTLSLDMAVTDHELFSFLDSVDELVLRHRGRIYLAKDARVNAEMFREMYPNYQEFERIKATVDPHNSIRSDLSYRLKIGGVG